MNLFDRLAARIALLVLIGLAVLAQWPEPASSAKEQRDAEEVVFWHFWGGEDRQVVNDVVSRFNASQSQYRVRAVAMPGNNLDLKMFLSITGGDPPDLINQDDPILGDWAARVAQMRLAVHARPALPRLAQAIQLAAGIERWPWPTIVAVNGQGRLYCERHEPL